MMLSMATQLTVNWVPAFSSQNQFFSPKIVFLTKGQSFSQRSNVSVIVPRRNLGGFATSAAAAVSFAEETSTRDSISSDSLQKEYAELKPVPCLTYADAELLREKCATPVLKQVRSDVIRYRYGDEQHLDEALKRIFQFGLGGGIPRRSAPVLQNIREEVTEDGKYCLVLVFEAKALQLSDFEKRQAKFTSFFGPGISSEIVKGENDLYEVRLISNTTL